MNRTISRLRFSNRVKMMLTIVFMSISSILMMETCALTCCARQINNNAITDTALSVIKNDGMASVNDSVADSLRIYIDSMEIIKTTLINEVDDYINSVAPRSKMKGEYIVTKCLENDFDITLLLSQAHQETHFATCGSNNCFGMYNKKRYSHPHQSVDDYISLMKRRYVINRTTEQFLASNVRMENGNGKYSTSSNYASVIGKIRNKIINKTNIQSLFDDLQNLNELVENYSI